MSFKPLDSEDLVISSELITAPVWTDYVSELKTFFTSSAQENSSPGAFYLDVYQTGSNLENAEVQFSVVYCDKKGSGSLLLNPSVPGISPSSINFGTYRNLVTGDEDTDIKFGEKTPEFFYALSFDRARYKEKLRPGTFKLTLNQGGSVLTLRDDSEETTVRVFTDAGRVFELYASSSLGQYTATNSNLYRDSGSYGKLFPDIGVVLLNGNTLAAPFNIGGLGLLSERQNNVDNKNTRKLFNAIKAGASFKANSEETISSNFIFIRARNSEFNYSTNPSYITGSGELRFRDFIDDPRTYFTTVGLYNNNNDLLAVAKLSRPLLKDSRKEALIRIKLDY